MRKQLQSSFDPRQYMISRDFEVFYYSDRHLPSVDLHTHDYYEVYFFLNGNVTIEIQGKMQKLKSGDIIILPPGLPHQNHIGESETGYERFIFWFTEDYLARLTELSPDYGYLPKLLNESQTHIFHPDSAHIHDLHARLLRLLEEQHSEHFGHDMQVLIDVSDLLLALNRTVYELRHPPGKRANGKLYDNLLSYIETHLQEDLTLDHLASEFYVSKYYIAHLFKEEFGISVHSYIQKKRLQLSLSAISSGVPITDAYLMCNFKDYSVFYRAFKKEFGLSPKEYRELHGVVPEKD